MGDEIKNDYDSIAEQIEFIAGAMIKNTHNPNGHSMEQGDSVTITKNAWIGTQVDLGRLAAWVKGLAQSHREYGPQAPHPDERLRVG